MEFMIQTMVLICRIVLLKQITLIDNDNLQHNHNNANDS